MPKLITPMLKQNADMIRLRLMSDVATILHYCMQLPPIGKGK